MSPRTKWPIHSRYCVQRRPVDAELVIERRDRARIGERPEDRAADVARQQLPAGEHHAG